MTKEVKHGFSEIRSKFIGEIEATLYEMEHIKTGARLIYLDREDENKTFSIGFPTPPCDDTGVFHIIEHSVLCGSKKYPMRDPFSELLKGSLNTFLNAMTYEDRTIYPVSSRCEKDFLNLVDVYMDAVLNPNLKENPSIFSQEGWHYEYDEENRALSLNGVVYNEMKGAYSSADELALVAMNRALWKKGIYQYDSGGDPAAIPCLSYEGFCQAYDKYYHPSNAKIILDGRMDLDKVLPLLSSHLDRFEKREATVYPSIEETHGYTESKIDYEIAENEEEKERARVAFGYVCSDFSEKEEQIALSILSDLLCGSNASPLKKELLDRGLCKDAAMYSVKSRKTTLIIEARDAEEESLIKIEEAVNQVIERLVRDGIDKDMLRATLNSIEFRTRERDFGTLPTGIAFAMSIYGHWMYGGAPEDALTSEAELASIREKIETNYFEELLERFIIKNDRSAKVIMLPDKTLGRRMAEEESKRLKDLLSKMSEEELSEIKAKEEALRLWQESDEDELIRATLPSLSLSDIRERSCRPDPTESLYNGVKTLDLSVKTNGIVYISMFFDARDLAKEELVVLSTLASALLNLPTEKRDTLSLQNDVKANLGSLFASFALGTRGGEAIPYLKIGASALSSKGDDLVRLCGEALLSSILDDPEEIGRIIKQTKANLESAIIGSGEAFALSRTEAALSEAGAITEYLSGYEAYKVISDIAENEEKIKKLSKEVKELMKILCDRRRLTVTAAGEGSTELAKRLIDLIPEGDCNPKKKETPLLTETEEFLLTPSRVAYAVLGGKDEEIVKNLGLLRVIRSILSYEYLWNTVRVKSGAYGAGFVPRRDGSLSFYSYRDPSPESSLKFYRESADYLINMADEGEDVTKFIIGAIGEYDTLLTPRVRVALAQRDYLAGFSSADEEATMQEMLAVTTEDLRRGAELIRKITEKGRITIVGGRDQLNSMKNPPKTVIEL